MAFTVAQPMMIQSAKFTSNATAIAHLLFLIFGGLEATKRRNTNSNAQFWPI
jgi:hypothetical protein